jgi:hypothetical protein
MKSIGRWRDGVRPVVSATYRVVSCHRASRRDRDGDPAAIATQGRHASHRRSSRLPIRTLPANAGARTRTGKGCLVESLLNVVVRRRVVAGIRLSRSPGAADRTDRGVRVSIWWSAEMMSRPSARPPGVPDGHRENGGPKAGIFFCCIHIVRTNTSVSARRRFRRGPGPATRVSGMHARHGVDLR